MINVRHGAKFASGMTATGFWLGLTVGRFVLGFVTPRIGEKLAIAVCLRRQHLPTSAIQLTLTRDLPSHRNGPRAPLLARATVLCRRCLCRPPRLLPWAHVSSCDGRLHEVTSQAPTRLEHWVCSSVRWDWRRYIPLHHRCCRAGEGCQSFAANHTGAAGIDLADVDGLAENQ